MCRAFYILQSLLLKIRLKLEDSYSEITFLPQDLWVYFLR